MAESTFDGPLQVGLAALTSGQSSIASVNYTRTFRLSGATGTTGFVFPAGTENVDAKLRILTAGSAAASDDIVVSAQGGVNLITIDAVGSAVGVLRNTTVGLGILTTSSAAAALSATAEVSAEVTMTKSDQATVYQLELTFSRARVV